MSDDTLTRASRVDLDVREADWSRQLSRRHDAVARWRGMPRQDDGATAAGDTTRRWSQQQRRVT